MSETPARHTAEISLDHFFEGSLELMCITDFEGRFQRLNPLWEQTLGWSSDELMGRPFVDFVHDDDRDTTSELAATLIAGKPIVRFENRVCTRDGQNRWFVWSANADLDEKLIYATARDITQEKELERKFLRSQRMEAIGALSAGIAHDLNNILSPIMLAANLLETNEIPAEDLKELRETIQGNVKRGAGIVRQLLDFSRGSKEDITVVDPRRLAQDVVKLARETFPKNIDVRVDIARDLWRIEANPTKVHQVLMNLAVNARDAMPHGGTLTISADNVDLREQRGDQGLDTNSDRAVRLTVTDTGKGIPEEHQANIFEHFFTTKEQGKGTGLGLATVKGIIESLGGTISFTSAAHTGTSFTFVIPGVVAEAENTVPEVRPIKGTGETILIVDDEQAVRKVLEKTLQYHGYEVLAAVNGKDALEKFAAASDRIPLVITDVEMPVMDGLSMLIMMQRQTPGLKALICTGGQFQANGVKLATFKQRFEDCIILQKPFSVGRILQVVKEQLSPPLLPILSLSEQQQTFLKK